MTIASIRKQLATLRAIIEPARSLAARLDALSSDERAEYARWQARYDQWFERCRARHSDEIDIEARPYARMLDGYGPPALRKDVETSLFGNPPRILLTDTADNAARKWMELIQS